MENVEGSLRLAFGSNPPDPTKLLRVLVPAAGDGTGPRRELADTGRDGVVLGSGGQTWDWRVPSLRALFRGDRPSPQLGDEPTEYRREFSVLDMHVLEVSRFLGPRRDAELEEIFSALRRRPDGRSLGKVHDYLWKGAALMLALHPLSQAEFEAILARLEKSCRRFGQGPTSRNLVATLEETIGQVV